MGRSGVFVAAVSTPLRVRAKIKAHLGTEKKTREAKENWEVLTFIQTTQHVRIQR